jgi:hypothetical protein
MKILLLEADSNKYQTLFPKNEADFDIIERLNGEPLSRSWSPIKVEVLIEEPEDKNLPVSDFPSMTTSALPVFSQKAVDALKDLLLSNGELLPLDFPGGTYYIFNVTTVVDALNVPECDAVYFPTGRIMTIHRYQFHPHKLNGLTIFKVPQFLLAPIFVTDDFLKQAESAGLTGFKFKQVWTSDPQIA